MLIIFTILFVAAHCADLSKPKLQFLRPGELQIELPEYKGKQLITFRISVKRADNKMEDMELEEKSVSGRKIIVYDKILDLKKDGSVYYVLVFADRKGYHTVTGSYVFDGVFLEKPTTTTTDASALVFDTETKKGVVQFISRFGDESSEKSTETVVTDTTETSSATETGTGKVTVESRFGDFHVHYHGGGGYDQYQPYRVTFRRVQTFSDPWQSASVNNYQGQNSGGSCACGNNKYAIDPRQNY